MSSLRKASVDKNANKVLRHQWTCKRTANRKVKIVIRLWLTTKTSNLTNKFCSSNDRIIKSRVILLKAKLLPRPSVTGHLKWKDWSKASRASISMSGRALSFNKRTQWLPPWFQSNSLTKMMIIKMMSLRRRFWLIIKRFAWYKWRAKGISDYLRSPMTIIPITKPQCMAW